jgi:uncharacterized membrane protein
MVLVFLVSVCGLVLFLSLLGSPGFRDGRGRARGALALIYFGFGLLHLSDADAFLPIMPRMVPFPKLVVELTGGCELAGAIGLVLPATRRWAGACLALYAICVFPANLKHAFGHVVVSGLPNSGWYHALRLAFQPVIVWWGLYAGEVIDWPFPPHRPAFADRVGLPEALAESLEPEPPEPGALARPGSAPAQDQRRPRVPVDPPLEPEAPVKVGGPDGALL